MPPTPKFVQARKSYLLAPITQTETGSFILNGLTDLYGNNLAIADFAGTVVFTFNPGGADEELISATGFTVNANGSVTVNAGIIRALQGKSPYTTGGTATPHYAGTIVVVSDAPQIYQQIIAYVNSLALANAVAATNALVGYVMLTRPMPVNPRAVAALVSQQSSPNMTLQVNPFSWVGGNSSTVAFAGGVTPTMTAPVSNPRIDLIVYNTDSAAVAVRTGTEASSPTVPTPTTNDLVLCSVRHVVGETSLKENTDGTNGYILTWYELGRYNTTTNLNITTASDGIDQTQTTQNGTTAVGEANATTKRSIIAQKFVPAVTGIKGVTLYKSANTGTFTGTVKIAIQADSGGSPSGSDLASYTITNAVYLLLAVGAFTVTFSSEYTALVPGNSYWIVVTPSTSDTSNHPNLGTNTAGGYAAGVLKYNNSTDGWVTVATVILYFQTISALIGATLQGDTTGMVPLFARPYSFLGLSGSATPSFSIPGGLMGLNGGLKLNLATNGSGGTLTIAYNGSTLISFSAPLASASAGAVNNYTAIITIFILNQGSLSSQTTYGFVAATPTGNNAGTFPTNGFVTPNSGSQTNTSSIDTSQPGVLTVTLSSSTLNLTTVEKIG